MKRAMNSVSSTKTPLKHTGFEASFQSSKSFAARKYERTWVVDQILLPGQPAVVGGPAKTLKTSLMVDFAVSLGTGTPFLDRFDVPRPVRTAVISGESGDAVIQDLARRICASKDTTLSDAGVYWMFQLPRLASRRDLASLTQSLSDLKIEVVIIDPLYLCLFGGAKMADACNLFDVGPILSAAANACLSAGATPIFVHHCIKPKAKDGIPTLDKLAFAGISEFARQWILLGRRNTFHPGLGRHELTMVTGGSAGHSGLWVVTVDEGSANQRSGRKWRVQVSTSGGNDHAVPVGRTSNARDHYSVDDEADQDE